MKRKRTIERTTSLQIQIPSKKSRIDLDSTPSKSVASPQYKQIISTLIPVGKNYASGSTSFLTLLKDKQTGRQFISKRIKHKNKHHTWRKTTEMLYNNEIEALNATVHCPDTPKIVAWRVGGSSSFTRQSSPLCSCPNGDAPFQEHEPQVTHHHTQHCSTPKPSAIDSTNTPGSVRSEGTPCPSPRRNRSNSCCEQSAPLIPFCSIHNSSSDNDHHDVDQIVMEYIDAVKGLEKGHQFPEYVTAIMAFFVLRALHSLHKSDYVHRDVKPDNLLISKDGSVKLVDFGLCVKKQTISSGSAVLGSRSYMAPELSLGSCDSLFGALFNDDTEPEAQPNGSQSTCCNDKANDAMIDCKSDIWSLGISLVEYLTGSNPVASFCTGDSEIAQSLAPQRFLQEKAASLLKSISDIHGEDCADFLSCCLTPLSNRRSASELLQHKWIRDNVTNSSDEELRRKISNYVSSLSLIPSIPRPSSDTTNM